MAQCRAHLDHRGNEATLSWAPQGGPRVSTIFEHRQISRNKAYVRGTPAQQLRRDFLEEVVVDESYLLEAAVL
jgi:hypothetical protein